ncbi:aminoacyl-tRNA hydrolase [Candidatus Kuenenbacteria bacterium]|nr:aminoacyl-tRNA hydrolase [Candidatus Kuenenbacteria bacterium]
MLKTKDKITIPKDEIKIIFSRSTGPGGQRVNKVSTKVNLVWNIWRSRVLNTDQKQKIIKKWANKIDKDGNFIVASQSERSQSQNRKKAIDKLQSFINIALKPTKKRMATVAPFWVKEKRLIGKKIRSEKKKTRSIKKLNL